MIDVTIITFLLSITMFFPIFSFIFNLLSFIMIKKERKIFAVLLAFSIACIAYVWKPGVEMDLYRWHLEMEVFKNYTLNDLFLFVLKNFEPLNYFIKYILSKTGNYNLLQFFVVFIGYLEIFLILDDYSKQNNIKLMPFTITLLFICISLQFIGFISGLWFYFAVINFFVGVYLDFIKKTKRVHWVFYISSICIHISTLLIFILLVFVKKLKKKINIWELLFVFILFFSIDKIIIWLNNYDISIFKYIYELYYNYFLFGSQFDKLNGGSNLIFGIYRLIICILIIIFYRKNILDEFGYKYYNIITTTIATILPILFNANVFVRFILYVQLMVSPILLQYFNTKTSKNKFFLCTLIFVSILIMGIKQYNLINISNIMLDIEANIFKPVFITQ